MFTIRLVPFEYQHADVVFDAAVAADRNVTAPRGGRARIPRDRGPHRGPGRLRPTTARHGSLGVAIDLFGRDAIDGSQQLRTDLMGTVLAGPRDRAQGGQLPRNADRLDDAGIVPRRGADLSVETCQPKETRIPHAAQSLSICEWCRSARASGRAGSLKTPSSRKRPFLPRANTNAPRLRRCHHAQLTWTRRIAGARWARGRRGPACVAAVPRWCRAR